MIYVFNLGTNVVCLTCEGSMLTNVETGAAVTLQRGESVDWLLNSWGAEDIQKYEYIN